MNLRGRLGQEIGRRWRRRKHTEGRSSGAVPEASANRLQAHCPQTLKKKKGGKNAEYYAHRFLEYAQLVKSASWSGEGVTEKRKEVGVKTVFGTPVGTRGAF